MHSKALAVAQHMLDRLMNVYGDPGVPSVQDFLREYTEQLVEFNPEELAEGRRIVLATHKYQRWPRPAECRSACQTARERIKRREAQAQRGQVRTDKRVFCIIRKDHDRIQWAAWMDRLAREGQDEMRAQAEASGELATHSNFPKEYDGLEGFISVGPFALDRDHDSHTTGWVTVHDANGRQIR